MTRVHDPMRPSAPTMERLVTVPTIVDARGRLSVVEAAELLPFSVQRVFWVYDLAAETLRGGHAHRALHEFVVCVRGTLEIAVFDGRSDRTHALTHPGVGLHLPPNVWRVLRRFSPDAVYVVLASTPYDPADYIHDWETFLREVGR